MRFHDYHLKSYRVLNHGSRIQLELNWPYPGEPRADSVIEFTEVSLYHIVHTGGAIITDIDEIPVRALIEAQSDFVRTVVPKHGGLHHWRGSIPGLIDSLEQENYRGFLIGSAIGFEGFVVSKSAHQVEGNNQAEPTALAPRLT